MNTSLVENIEATVHALFVEREVENIEATVHALNAGKEDKIWNHSNFRKK